MPLASIPSPLRSVWHVGPLPVRAQALCIIAGILLAILLTDRRYRKSGGAPGVIAEVAATRITERGATRADDRTSEAAMEDRKREGYF